MKRFTQAHESFGRVDRTDNVYADVAMDEIVRGAETGTLERQRGRIGRHQDVRFAGHLDAS